jgi:DNA-binding LacI/PurR family transcriptional regulator
MEELSESAVDLLVNRIEGREKGPSGHIVFEPRLVVRQSTAAPPGRKA